MDGTTYMCEEIVIEILSRLPTKSLVRFMAVCRLWKSIITSPQFQLSKRPTKLLVHTPRGCHTLLEENRGLMFETDFPIKHYSYDSASVIGSDDGLICIRITSPGKEYYYSYDDIIIWNPFIRKHVVIPDDPSTDDNLVSHSVLLSGFGDNKYVRVVVQDIYVDDGYDCHVIKKYAVEIYSLKAGGTWRRKYLDRDITRGIQELFCSCALLRGRLHWICGREILSFELEDEVFEENIIMVPESVRSHDTTVDVTVIRETQLAVITNENGMPSTVWVMEVYGDVNSWNKLCNIDLAMELGHNWVERNMVHLLKDGELLLGLGGITVVRGEYRMLVTYNQQTGKTSWGFDVSVSSASQGYDFTSYYKESLVLLGDLRAVADQTITKPVPTVLNGGLS